MVGSSPRVRGLWGVVWLALAATALPALRPGDPVAADAIWAAAQAEAPADPAARIWVDAARVQQELAPWQAAFPQARARLRWIAAGRRAALRHDRGGRRRPVQVERP